MTDEAIRSMFEGAGDFETRQLRSGDQAIYAYYIDGDKNEKEKKN